MRLSLARALFHGKFIVVDSELASLDKITRSTVLMNLKRFLNNNKGTSIIMRGEKTD